MFNKKLKAQVVALCAELAAVKQMREGLNAGMIVMHLDAGGRIELVNENFEQELLRK